MSKKKFKKTALHSGIGDGQDLLVKQPETEVAQEEFKIAARARGKKRNKANVYPKVDFQYGVHYKGKTVETYHEEPFDIDIPAYPKRVLEYDIEERRFLCYDRFWEIQADFEATVMRMTAQYAIEYEAMEEVNTPMKFRLKWGGAFDEDPLNVFNNKNTNFVGSHNSNAYVFDNNRKRLRDALNRNEFSGVLADDSVYPYDTEKINMKIEFKPLPALDAGNAISSSADIPQYQRWHFANDSYNTIGTMPVSKFQFEAGGPNGGKYGHRDDDVVGFIFKANKTGGKLNGYIFLWESHSRVMTGRRVKKLDGFNIATNTIVDGGVSSSGAAQDGTYAHTDATTTYVNSSGNPIYPGNMSPTNATNISRFKNFHTSKGWGAHHQKIYKVTNNVLTEVATRVSPGWDFNEWHTVRLEDTGGVVKIYTKIGSGSEQLAYSVNTSSMNKGTVGLCNMSQAVEYKNLEITNVASTGGYMPIDGSYVTVEKDGQFKANAKDYIKPSVEKKAQQEGVSYSDIEVGSITVEYEGGSSGGGEVTLPAKPFTGPITVKVGTRKEGRTGRIPENPNEWLSWDGVGDYTVATNAEEYIKATASPPGEQAWDSGKYEITNISGVVKDDPSAAYDLPWSPRAENITGWFDNPISNSGSIILHSNNPIDADAVYNATYYKCGFETICPDNLSKETGVVAVPNTNVLFAAEIAQFFNRNTYINKKKVYTLLYPVWTEQIPEVLDAGKDPVLSLGGCVIEPGIDPIYADLIPCRPEKDDFYFDGTTLILWTCSPPVKYKTVSYSYGIYAFDGEIRRMHYTDFEAPNPWTTYRLIPIIETIEADYDYVKWVGTEALEWIAPYTQVRLRTKRYFIPSWTGPYEGLNKGIVTTDQDITVEIPPIPEYYLDPTTMTEMPYGYSNFVFLLESKNGFNPDSKLKVWWLSDPSKTSKNVDKSPANTNKLNNTYMLRALNMADRVVIHCDENPVYTDWTSGKYMGYGKLNGQEPLRCDGAGKADMTNISTEVVYFPDNFVKESIEGPFIDVYVDQEKHPGAEVRWILSSDKKLVHFFTDYKDINTWYTDWKSNWIQYEETFKINTGEIKSLGRLEDLTIDLNGEDQKDVIVEKLEITTDNSNILSWSKELTEEQLKELSGNIDVIDIMSIKDSWVQYDTDANPTIGVGDWSFVKSEGIDKITNKRNQNGRSMWYNKAHQEATDYGFRFNVKVEDTSDDDMIGAIFRFDPETKSHYSVEWDCGGTSAKGLRLVKYIMNSTGTGFKAAEVLAQEKGFYWGKAQKLTHSIMVKAKGRNIKVYVNNILKFNVEDNSTTALTKGAWGPVTHSQPLTYFWDLQMFEPQESPEMMAKIKDGRPFDWSPMIHNGYYYMGDREKYLYAEKIVQKVSPNIYGEIIISPRPEQGSAIIVQDNNGNNFRKVTFHDNNYEMTLRNVETFKGNGNAGYYLGYSGIDESTLTVTVNDKIEPYIFYSDKSKIEFMRKIEKTDEIKAYYKVLYSYMIDMNYDVPGNRARITLHDKYDPAAVKNMTVTYEVASETPFYHAKELKFNPLLNHNHAGFLFITEEEQVVKDVSINVSPKTLEINKARKILITAKALDEFGNPAVGKEVKLYRNNTLVDTTTYNNITNAAGEVYYYYTPINSVSDIPSTYLDEYKVVCEGKYDIDMLNYYERANMDRRYIDIELSKDAVIGGTSDVVKATIYLRDKNFRRLSGQSVRIEIINTNGVKNVITKTIPTNRKLELDIVGTGQKQGYVYIKATHDMGVEDVVTLKAVRVLGG